MGKGKTELTASEMAEEAELVANISSRLKHVLEERGWTVYKQINECHVSKNSVYTYISSKPVKDYKDCKLPLFCH